METTSNDIYEQTDESKKCTIDNLFPNWKNQELSDEMLIDEDLTQQTKTNKE